MSAKVNPLVIGITGGAGAGKTTLCNELVHILAGMKINACVYHMDWRMIGSSDDRRELLNRKAVTTDGALDGWNQYNWWNWQAVENDIKALASGKSISVDVAYDRATGAIGKLELESQPVIICEGAILGPPAVVSMMRKVFYLHVDDETRLVSLLKKDRERRSSAETAARFLVTEFSETIYLPQLMEWVGWSNMLMIDRIGSVDIGPIAMLPNRRQRPSHLPFYLPHAAACPSASTAKPIDDGQARFPAGVGDKAA